MAVPVPSSPPPARRNKRVSLHHKSARPSLSSESASATAAAAGLPLQPSRLQNIMNDDTADKATRRKSAHFGELGHGGPSTGGGGGGGAGAGSSSRVVSAAGLQQSTNTSGGSGRDKKGKGRISAVASAGLPAVVPLEVNSSKFEEWMKLATDNKITVANTWNFALIDYFADLTLLRNDEDQSINFQKASCTLDGCVKIWTSRVDSVATETGKLLSGLAGGGADDRDELGEGDEEEGGEARPTRKTHRSEATMAKSFDVLKIKKFDLEFSVDPLFKKTKEDFDEGGAMGLLLNHLGVDGKGRLVFDAGDATLGDEQDDMDPADEDMVDLGPLREYIPSTKRLQAMHISDTLLKFKFSSDASDMPDFSTLLGLKDTFDNDAASTAYGGGAGGGDLSMVQEEQDFFGGEDFDTGAPMGGGFDDYPGAGADDDGDNEGEGGAFSHMATAGPGEHMPLDGRKHGGDLVFGLLDADDSAGMFDYFDKGFGKNWAGAEHYKLRRVARKDPTAPTAPKAPKAAKAPFTIDFNAPAQSSKTLFASSSKASITLPKRTKRNREKREEWLLPDDMHFSSRQLTRLFLKPKYTVRTRRNNKQRDQGPEPNAHEEIDENYWAQAAAERTEGADGLAELDADEPMPFETQFFHDDGDDGGFGFSGDGGSGGAPGFDDDDDLWAGTQGQQLRRARPENVHFAKKAKRVDVKRLKDDIWSGLKTLVPDPETEEGSAETVEPITPVGEAKQFDTVIQSLRQAYPQDKMSEISTSFCFICLLHLANEEGLRIETARFDGQEGLDVGCIGEAEDVEQDFDAYQPAAKKSKVRGAGADGDEERRDRIVGELQALKVYRDSTAGRAA